jgi:glyoxylase-like metal-dependent hydrolase (beta-lactamase superfamily II)
MLPAGLPATTGWQPVLPGSLGANPTLPCTCAILSNLDSTPMFSSVRPAPDFDRIASDIAIWHAYDPGVKAELYSTCLLTSAGACLIDPIPLQSETLEEVVRPGHVAGVIVTSSNHHRRSVQFAKQFSAPMFAHAATFPDNQPRELRRVADGDEICDGLRVIGIEGAAAGEIVLHYTPAGGTLIVGDALINFEPYGFTFLPGKYCSNEKEMRRSLRKLLDYKTERILFAHGTPILSRASDQLRRLLDSDR